MPATSSKPKPKARGSGSQCGAGSPGKPGFSSKNSCHGGRAAPAKGGKGNAAPKGTAAKPAAAGKVAAQPGAAVPAYARTAAGLRDRIGKISADLATARAAREKLPAGSHARGMNLDTSVSLLQKLHAARHGLAAQLKGERAAGRPSLTQRTADVRAKLASNVMANPIAKAAEHPVDTAASALHGLAARARLGTIDPSEFRPAAHAAVAGLEPQDRARLTRDLGAGKHHDADKAADALAKRLGKVWRRYGKMGEAPPPRWITPEPAASTAPPSGATKALPAPGQPNVGQSEAQRLRERIS